MNLGEIKQRVKRTLGDETGALIEEDDIISWVNEAQLDIARKTEVLQDFTTIDVVANQESYDIPADFLKIVSVSYAGISLPRTTRAELDSISPARAADTFQDIPFKYYNWGTKLWLYPKPLLDLADGITFYYVFRPSNLVSDADVSELPVQMHSSIIDYCVARGRDLNEEFYGSSLSQQRFDTAVMLSRDEQKDSSMDSYPAIRCLPDDMG